MADQGIMAAEKDEKVFFNGKIMPFYSALQRTNAVTKQTGTKQTLGSVWQGNMGRFDTGLQGTGTVGNLYTAKDIQGSDRVQYLLFFLIADTL